MAKTIVFLILYIVSNKIFAESIHSDDLLHSHVPALMEKYGVPGVAIGILGNGSVSKYYFFGYADLSSKKQINEFTGFNVGSISKSVTAWGVMKLVQQGKIDIDAPIQNYVTRWKIPSSPYDAKEVTVRRLLNHTSGLSQHAVAQFELNETVPTLEAAMSGYPNMDGEILKLVREPGTEWSYSGGGFTLLQLMIEEVTGQPFDVFMQKEVLHPLGMFDSSFQPNNELLKTLAKSYDRNGKETSRLRFAATGAAGLQTTPNDLAIFANAALSISDKIVAGRGVLTPEAVFQMLNISTNAKLEDGNLVHRNYGLGYFISDIEPAWFGHGGDNRGWHSRFIMYPDTRNGIVVLTNSSNGFWMAQDIYCLFAQDTVGGDEANCN